MEISDSIFEVLLENLAYSPNKVFSHITIHNIKIKEEPKETRLQNVKHYLGWDHVTENGL